jgi:hypothetical protein
VRGRLVEQVVECGTLEEDEEEQEQQWEHYTVEQDIGSDSDNDSDLGRRMDSDSDSDNDGEYEPESTDTSSEDQEEDRCDVTRRKAGRKTKLFCSLSKSRHRARVGDIVRDLTDCDDGRAVVQRDYSKLSQTCGGRSPKCP